MRQFFIGLFLGAALMYAIQPATSLVFGRTYWVKAIKSHYPHVNDNSQTNVIVWIKGREGHTKEVFCEFAPDVQFRGNDEIGWTGLTRIRVKGVANTWAGGEHSFYAEKLE